MKSKFSKLPNVITITRILMSVIFIYLILERSSQGNERFIYLITVFFMICFSDLLDGKIARKTGTVSNMGAKLDVFADLLYMILSYVALIIIGVIPLWFLVFVLGKFLEFTLTSKFIKRYNKASTNPFVFDKVGRLTSASFFIIPGVTCVFTHFMTYIGGDLIKLLLYITLFAGIYSSYLRIKNCITIMD